MGFAPYGAENVALWPSALKHRLTDDRTLFSQPKMYISKSLKNIKKNTMDALMGTHLDA
jgi:hypothetical protein